MTSTPFVPYWRAVSEPADPYSWVFFVVAQIGGHHRPVAVVSSVGYPINDESLQGYPLTAACQRVVTIFSDRANHPAARAELALAAGYYGEHHNHQEQVALTELNRLKSPQPRNRPWDRTGVHPFPFLTACLLQSVGFDAQQGSTRQARPEPLGTVYDDASIEWGMVVIDITRLDEVSYGIVGFNVAEAKFVPSAEEEINPTRGYPAPTGVGMFERGELRVMDEIRPRNAMSAAEYLARFKHEIPEFYQTFNDNVSKLLARVPVIKGAAMDHVWPSGSDGHILPPLAGLSVNSKPSLRDQAITSLILSTLDVDDFDMSIFDEVRQIPDFHDLLWLHLKQHSARLGDTRAAGQLIRLALANQDHLSLEQLNSLSVDAISGILSVPEMGKITSISLCIDSIRGTPSELVEVLSQADTLRELYFLQSPTRESDALSAQLFEALAAQPHILRRAKVMLAGAYSAALRKRFWLPSVPKMARAVQVAPLDVFPVQQILVRRQIGPSAAKFHNNYIHLGDGLLKPERFAAGLLLYLHTLIASSNAVDNAKAQLFSFSSTPSSLADDPLTTAEVSPIFAENFAVPTQRGSGGELWPRVRALVPGGWTVIVSHELLRDVEATRRSSMYPVESQFIRYAFVRARQQPILVDAPPPLTPPNPEELEVVGLREFLQATAPEVDPAVIDGRLKGVADDLAATPYQGTLPDSIQLVSVLSPTDAAGMLWGFLEDAREVNKHLLVAMNQTSRERIWYPELLSRGSVIQEHIKGSLPQAEPEDDEWWN